ncbi:MAG: AAA family ATPase [Planctomycetes bacterium]|nr:AAA family ATPase [Planctomycetota bacterium]
MRFTGFYIERFGIFRDQEVDGLASGLNLFLGENEAGKSTLLDFIRQILFGFPDARQKATRRYLEEGQAGCGQIRTALSTGKEIRIERKPGRSGGKVALVAGGEPIPESELNRLLGGVAEGVFRNVYGFSLAELQSFDNLDNSDVSNALFAAGAGVDPQAFNQARKKLEGLREELFKPGGQKPKINQRLGDLESRNSELRQKQGDVETFEEKTRELDNTENALSKLRLEKEFLEKQGAIDKARNRLQEIENELGEVEVDSRWFLVETDLRNLGSRLSEWRRLLEARPKQEENIKGVNEKIGEILKMLPKGWDEDKVHAADRSVAVEDELGQHENKLDQARENVETLESDLRRLREDIEKLPKPQTRAPDLEAAKERRNSWRDLKEKNGQREKLRGEMRDLDLKLVTARSAARRLFLAPGIGLIVLGILLGATGYLSALPGLTGAGVAMLIAGVGLIALSLFGRRTSEPESDVMLRERIKGLDGEMALLMGNLEINHSDLDSSSLLDDRFNDAVTVAERAAGLRTQHLDLEEELKNAEKNRGEKAADLKKVEEAWKQWLRARDFPETLTPRGTRDVLALLKEGQRLLGEREKLGEDLSKDNENLNKLESSARKILETLCRAVPATSALPKMTEELISEWEEAKTDKHTRDTLQGQRDQTLNQIDGIDKELNGERFKSLREELAEEPPNLEERLVEIEKEDGGLRYRRGELKADIDRLASSQEVADLALKVENLKAEIQRLAADWARAAIAHELLERARKKFEEESQPAVIQAASRYFEMITGGRYHRIQKQLEGNDLVVIATGDAIKSHDKLSRGATEQLYLSLRFGHLETRDSGEPLPIILDDILVNFDQNRARRAAEAIAALSKKRQVLYFTCHPLIEEILRPYVGACFEMNNGAIRKINRTTENIDSQ